MEKSSSSMTKVMLSAMLGNGLEWFDFALYAYLAKTISVQFFPAGNPELNLLAAFGIFAVGFVARPLGGVLFGYIGDRFGRRISLAAAILMMAIPTGCIGLLPTYAQIGVWAPILLTLIRLLQGLSLGGEFSGSITFLVEHAPAHKRGLIGSTTISSLLIGFMLGSFVVLMIKSGLTPEQFESWGWRVPFIAGVFIGLTGYYIRHRCDESPVYEAAKEKGELLHAPAKEACKNFKLMMVRTAAIYVMVTMPFYLLSTYFVTYTQAVLGRTMEEALTINVVCMLMVLILTPLSAKLSDKIGRRRLLLGVLGMFAVLSFPTFYLMQQGSFALIFVGQMLMALCVGMYTAPLPALLVEAFPTHVRYTGMAISYNISACVFGGTVPMVCQFLMNETGSYLSLVAYLGVCWLIGFWGLWTYEDRYDQPL